MVDEKLCEERHQNITRLIDKIDGLIDKLFTRLNWFMIITIGALITAVVDLLIRSGV